MGDAKEESEAKVLDRVYEHIPSCISGSSTVADASSIWPKGPAKEVE